MIFDSSYSNKEKDIEVDKLIGKRYGLLSSIRFNGIGSKRLIVEETSEKFKNLIVQKTDLIYSNIEIRRGGIIVYVAEGLKRFSWIIPFYLSLIHI